MVKPNAARRLACRGLLILVASAVLCEEAKAQHDATPDLSRLAGSRESELAPVVSRYSADREALLRRWDVPYSPARRERMEPGPCGMRRSSDSSTSLPATGSSPCSSTSR